MDGTLDQRKVAENQQASTTTARRTEALRQDGPQPNEENDAYAKSDHSRYPPAFASQPSDSKCIKFLRASVRPVLTYAFFALFATVKILVLCKMLNNGSDITDALDTIWDEETQALFAAVISFWFGQRGLAKFHSGEQKALPVEHKIESGR